jgi:hypothetical protein
LCVSMIRVLALKGHGFSRAARAFPEGVGGFNPREQLTAQSRGL